LRERSAKGTAVPFPKSAWARNGSPQKQIRALLHEGKNITERLGIIFCMTGFYPAASLWLCFREAVSISQSKKLYFQPYDAIWPGLFPPCCVTKTWNLYS